MVKQVNISRLMVIGPLPPPVGGGAITFQVFCEVVKECAQLESFEIINSSASYFKPRSRIFTVESLARARRIMWQLCRKVGNVDAVLIFGTNGFVCSFTPFLLFVTKATRTKCYVRVFGGSLHNYYVNLPSFVRWLFSVTLNHLDGLIVQTPDLYEYFSSSLDERVYLFPQYRNMDDTIETLHRDSLAEELRLVFIGHVKESKGVFVLLESLRRIITRTQKQILCDLYGPIAAEDQEQFLIRVNQLKGVAYRGVLYPDQVVSTLHNYDALILPTYYPNEGHPGVIIEAMMAGLPVITTDFGSIPDLVQDGVNGLLVKPKDVETLSEAILRLADDRERLKQLAERNYERRKQFDAKCVVPRILQELGVPLKPAYTSDCI